MDDAQGAEGIRECYYNGITTLLQWYYYGTKFV